MSPKPLKKSKLDELQAEIAESLAIAERAGELRAEAAVLEAEIQADKQQLARIQERVRLADLDHQAKLRSYTEQVQTARDELDSVRKSVIQMDKQRLDNEDELAKYDNRLKDVQDAITQLQTVKQRLEGENRHLEQKNITDKRDLESQVMETQTKINGLMAELQKQAYTHKLGEDRLKQQRDESSTQTSVYKQKAEQYALDLGAMEIEVANKRNLMASFDADMNKRKAEIETQQESIDTQSMAINGRKADLDAMDRKLRLDYRLAGQAYE